MRLLLWTLLIGTGALVLVGCRPNTNVVVVYASQDQVYAEPVLKTFERETGLEVRALYDSEAVKTVGLVQRLLQERAHPRCDVFWNNDEFRTRQLAEQNIFRLTNGWAAFGYRSRRIVINTNKVSAASAPRSLVELTNGAWRQKVAIAYPLFGSTATHFLALREQWGESNWLNWCQALQANKPFVVDGNSVVAQLVGRGEAWLGLTDSDDIEAEARQGRPVAALPMTPEMLLIPNTVGVIRGAPHPQAAQKLFDYLQSQPVQQFLVQARALEGSAIPSDSTPHLKVNWAQALKELPACSSNLARIFLR